MLVVSANWQIGDGSLGAPPLPSAVASFLAGVNRAAARGGWLADGRYEPVGGVEIVFAGDTFDRLLSREWLGATRPWDRGPAARAARERVTAGTLRAARHLIDGLGGLVRGSLRVPGADPHGRPLPARPVAVPVRVTLLEGNLDPDLGADAADGLLPREGIAIGGRWEGDGVRVEHGHAADPAWSSADGRPGIVPTLGATLRIDLLARFAATDGLASPRALVARLAAVNPVGWPALVTDAIAAAGARADALRMAWEAAVAAWRRSARRVGVSLDTPFDAIDAVAGMLLGDDPGAELAAALLAPPPRAEGDGTLVLGHPPAASSRSWESPRVICLGSPADDEEERAPGVVEIGPTAGDAQPPAVVVHPLQGERRQGPGAVATPRRRGAGMHGGATGRDGRYRIVDAA